MDLRRLLALPAVLALVAPSMLAGCGAADDADEEEGGRARRGARVSDSSERLAQAGAWKLPASVKAAGEKQYVGYDSPPKWSGGKNCTGTFTKGAAKLKNHLLSTYPGISSIGGYACRQNTANKAETSVHGTGRALDIMIPKIKGQADNTVGDAIANWLVVNAEDLGVQFIIWDQTKWNASYSSNKAKPYGGPVPHTDHIHVELDLDGAAMKTAWYKGFNDASGGALPDDADTAEPSNTDSADTGNADSGNADEADTADHANDDAGDETADVSSGCGDVTEAGSCNGNTLQFCENGELVSAPCGSGTTCGDDYPGSGYKVCSKGEGNGGNEPVSDSSDLTDSGSNADSGNADSGNANNEPPADAGAGCGFVSEVGMCANGQLSYCDNGSLKQVDCKAAGRSCGFDIGSLWFDCLLSCEGPPPLAPFLRSSQPAASTRRWRASSLGVDSRDAKVS